MKLVNAKLLNYKSIIDADLELRKDITCLVGMTGAGKTSVLELLSKIDDSRGFTIDDLPVKSKIADRFQKDEISADKIEHLIATFDVEDADLRYLPDSFGNLKQIEFTRFFDGGRRLTFKWSGDPGAPEGAEDPAIARIEQILAQLDAHVNAAQNRIPILPEQRTAYDAARKSLGQHMRGNPDEIGRMVANLKNAFLFMPRDDQLRIDSDSAMAGLESESMSVTSNLQQGRENTVYGIMPRPEYIPGLPELADRVPLDVYLNDPRSSDTFEAIGSICGFNKMQLNNIRNSETHIKSNYFDGATEALTKRFAEFWSQAQYELIVGLEGSELVFSIRDKKSDLITKGTQCSEGLKWVLALFFKINTLVSSKGSSHILLFDSPATAVHDAGKEEIRRFLAKVSEENRLQIVYTTHEKALIDPRHLERIRYVSKEHGDGTKVSEIKGGGIDSVRIEISKHIGSPAKYSLFGAPMTIHFEGRSDYQFIAALNEHAIDTGRRHLDPDLYSIDGLEGIDNSRYMMKICENLGLDFCFVVDGGPKSKSLKKELEGKFDKHFVELSNVVGKEVADIEDIIDYRLYRHLFNMHYPGLLSSENDVPPNGARKRLAYYQDLVKKHMPGSRIDKGGIAKYLVEVIRDVPDECAAPLERTMENYERLVALIEEKLNLASARP